MTDIVPSRALVMEVGTRACAVPLPHVFETMRPLPIEPIAGTPSFVKGISVIRGVATPIIDLGILLGTPGFVAKRFVTLQLGSRQVGLSVGTVLGVRDFSALTIQGLPPLLQGASQDVIEAIGLLDAQVLVVLRTGWELPDAALQALALSGGAP